MGVILVIRYVHEETFAALDFLGIAVLLLLLE